MSSLRGRYFKTLGFLETDTMRCKRALDRAYALRTFEIEHYWKRATYFWGFQVAIFAAFGLLWKVDMPEQTPGLITVALSILGVLTAVANSLSASGSKFWQENWERHIDMLEDKCEGRLHKTVWLPNGKISFSVSGINQTLSWFIIVFWTVTTIYLAYKLVGSPPIDLRGLGCISAWLWLIAIIVVIASGVLALRCRTSNLRGTIPNDDGNHTKTIEWCSCWRRRIDSGTFIRRYAPDEPNDDK